MIVANFPSIPMPILERKGNSLESFNAWQGNSLHWKANFIGLLFSSTNFPIRNIYSFSPTHTRVVISKLGAFYAKCEILYFGSSCIIFSPQILCLRRYCHPWYCITEMVRILMVFENMRYIEIFSIEKLVLFYLSTLYIEQNVLKYQIFTIDFLNLDNNWIFSYLYSKYISKTERFPKNNWNKKRY